MIDEGRIESALRSNPDTRPSPYFAKRVMNEIRSEAPAPFEFPWWKVIGAIVLGAGAVATGFQPIPLDPVVSLALLIGAASVATAERLLTHE